MRARSGLRWRTIALIVIGIVILFSALGAGAAFVNYILNYDHIHQGVQIQGVSLGGLSVPEAEARLKEELKEAARQPIRLKSDGWDMEIIPYEAGLDYNIEAMMAEAFAVGRTGYPWDRWREIRNCAQQGYEVPPQLMVNSAVLHRFINTITQKTDQPPRSASWKFLDGGKLEVVPGQSGKQLDVDQLFKDLKSAMWPGHSREVRLVVEDVEPSLTTEEARGLQIEELMASFRTKFDPSNANRVENLRLAAAAMDMYLIRPGGIFSFNAVVGPRIPESGYAEAPVVVQGQLVPGIGGGVCQVSTTLYNSVLRSNLPVVERNPHTLPSLYTAPGTDATVSYGYLDFKFANDLPGGVLIHAVMGPDYIEISLYGKKSSREQIRIEPQVLETYRVPMKKKPDPTLPKGQEVVDSQGYPGYRVRVWRIYLLDGKEIRREVISENRYLSVSGKVRVGTGPKAPAVPPEALQPGANKVTGGQPAPVPAH